MKDIICYKVGDDYKVICPIYPRADLSVATKEELLTPQSLPKEVEQGGSSFLLIVAFIIFLYAVVTR